MPPNKRVAGMTRLRRPRRSVKKEESADYRYFPDPDLIAVVVSEEQIEATRASLGQLPAELRTRLQSDYGLNDYDADVIVSSGRETVDFFQSVAKGAAKDGQPDHKVGKLASNWVGQEVMRYLNENGIEIGQYPVPADRLAELLSRIGAGEIDQTRAKEVLAEMQDSGCEVQAAFDLSLIHI